MGTGIRPGGSSVVPTSAMMMFVISWIPLRQISSDEVFESHLAVLLVCVLATTKTKGLL